MKKIIFLATLIVSFGLFESFLSEAVAFANEQESYEDITYATDSEKYIYFDSKGNIVKSNLETNTNGNQRTAINHESGRWVYYSELYDWGKKKKGHSNHYSFKYARHGSKAQVGGDTRKSNAYLKKWSIATTYGKRSDTFSCWYNPTGWY